MTQTAAPLQPSAHHAPTEGPVLLVVLDGVGIGPGDEGDAVARAHTPTLDRLQAACPWRTLRAHGTSVGLPSDGDMGNSEVGHNALGAGRVVDQGAKLVSSAIASSAIFDADLWRDAVARASDGHALHLIGLVSDGNVHSHIDHLHALIDAAHDAGIHTLRVHALTDGRDVGAQSSLEYLTPLEDKLAALSDAPDRDYRVASGGGRMLVTMDRYEADWAMVERGWNAHVLGRAPHTFPSACDAVRAFRADEPDISDQYLPPFVVTGSDNQPVGPIQDGDAVILFNFRGDRAIELCRAFDQDDFPYFDRVRRPDALFMGMTLYDGDNNVPQNYLVAPPSIDLPMSAWLHASDVRQFACSETQKYGHVTYFWNGNRSAPFDTETWVKVPSDDVPFDQRPWMKAAEITDATLDAIAEGGWRFGRINLANGDMVGHTGDLRAAILSVEAVDLCLERLVHAIDKARGALIILADHGNADDMFERDKKGNPKRDAQGRIKPRTSHTLNPVPCIVYRPHGASITLRDDLPDAGLGNIAATVLDLLGLAPPDLYLPSLIAAE